MTTGAQLSSHSVLGGSATYVQDGFSFLETSSQAYLRCAPMVVKLTMKINHLLRPEVPRPAPPGNTC